MSQHVSNVPRHRNRRRALWEVADPAAPLTGKALARAARIEGPHQQPAVHSALLTGTLRLIGRRDPRLLACQFVRGDLCD
jgi:hypothetical protein